MANNSLEDISSLLANAFSSSSSKDSSLPESVEQRLLYQTGELATLDDATSQRLHDELLITYNKYVASDKSKLPAFTHALKHLRPHLLGPSRKFEWWKLVLRPIIEERANKSASENAHAFVLETLDFDIDADKKRGGELGKESAFFVKVLLESYLKRTGSLASENEEYSLKDEHAAMDLEHILIKFGHRKPKVFLLTMDGIVVSRRYRLQALNLLSSFVKEQSTQLSNVSQTPLVEHLIQCLMNDLSSSVLVLALSTLLMLLPHIPSNIVIHLPRLFLIYSRLLCWEQLDLNGLKRDPSEHHEKDAKQPSCWDVLRSADNETDPKSMDLSFCFTFLYGLYPLNFTSFIRNPRRYLKRISFPAANELDFDQTMLRHRSKTFQRAHLLHQNFVNITSEEELAETAWQKKGPSSVVAKCMSLRKAPFPGLEAPRPPPSAKLPEPPGPQTLERDIPPQSLDDGPTEDGKGGKSRKKPPAQSNHEIFGLTRNGSARYPRRKSSGTSPRRFSKNDPGDSPTLPPVPQIPVEVQDPCRRSSVVSYVNIADKPPATTRVTDPSKKHLVKQLTLLRNELNFERFLKAQHLAHIASLRRRQSSDAAVPPDMENLLNTTKSLKSKLVRANESCAALGMEAKTADGHSKNTEHQQIVSLRKDLRQAEEKSKVLESSEIELKRVTKDKEVLQVELVSTNTELKSKESAYERARKSYERRIAELETELLERSGVVTGEGGQEAAEAALATANSRINALKADYMKLKHEHVELEMRCRELELEATDSIGQAKSSASAAAARTSTPSPQQRPLSMISDELQSPGYASSAGGSSGGYNRSRRGTGQSSYHHRHQDSGAPSIDPSIASSTSTKNPPFPLRRTGSGETMASDAASPGGSFYMQSKSAFSAESVMSDVSESSMSSARKLKNGLKSESGSKRLEKGEAEKMREKRQKAAMKKQGGLRGLRGMI
ncbi:MAG: hypothetical protein M1831_001680 [Alyxoria varia]|nr:MAG: hypothetical protein M1831_001680 [Alyxoria varia]